MRRKTKRKKKKFTFPKDFKVTIDSSNILIEVKGRNPIWIVFSIILILVGGFFMLTYHMFFSVFVMLGLSKIIIEITKKAVVYIDEEGFSFDGCRFDFEQVKNVTVSSKLTSLSLRFGASGTSEKTWITVFDYDKGETKLGKRLIVDYQQRLVEILNEFRRNNVEFIMTHFKENRDFQ